MVDIYLDDMKLSEIISGGKNDLRFVGNKGETLHLVLSDGELLNALDRIRMRCETRDLIWAVDVKRKSRDGEMDGNKETICQP